MQYYLFLLCLILAVAFDMTEAWGYGGYGGMGGMGFGMGMGHYGGYGGYGMRRMGMYNPYMMMGKK